MAVASMITLLYTATYILVAFVLPAYNTYKALEHHGDHDVRAWGIYWVVLAAISCLHYVVDCALCWLPGYYAIKLGFIVALWHPSVRLAEAMYDKVLSPLLATYEVGGGAATGSSSAFDCGKHRMRSRRNLVLNACLNMRSCSSSCCATFEEHYPLSAQTHCAYSSSTMHALHMCMCSPAAACSLQGLRRRLCRQLDA